MSGLLIRELELRGLAERILIVCPANLAFQWQRELKEKFDTKFLVMKGQDIREQFGVNQWLERNRVITSLDLAKRSEILPGLRQVHWDLVIVDEAHRMSAADESHKSLRYRLGELLRDSSDHILLLTATPHKGDPANFSLFLQLLDADAFADVKSIREAMDRRRAPFYLRRTKEAMVYFPERRADGSWAAEPIFTKRIPHTVDFLIDGTEFDLYRDVTRFVKRESARAAAEGEDPRARAIGFLMSLYQRRLASSTYAMRRSLRTARVGWKMASSALRISPARRHQISLIRKSWRRWRKASASGWRRCSRRSRSQAAPIRCTKRFRNCVALPPRRRRSKKPAPRRSSRSSRACFTRRASSIIRTSACSSSPSSRTRWTIS
jgi:hypothetical protein